MSLNREERQQHTDEIVSNIRQTVVGSHEHLRLVEELICVNVPVARTLASRYWGRGVDGDDLEQVAMMGLVNAALRFDPDAGDFMSFAVPTIRGELRRHFRDYGWMIRPPRRIQELQVQLGQARDGLHQRLGRSPRPSELAEDLGVEVGAVEEALAVDGCFSPTSLDGVAGSTPALGDFLGDEDPAFGSAEARTVLAPAVRGMSARDRRILQLRFFDQRSQQEIADDVGLTQSSVSRVLNDIMRDLRSRLVGDDATGDRPGEVDSHPCRPRTVEASSTSVAPATRPRRTSVAPPVSARTVASGVESSPPSPPRPRRGSVLSGMATC